MIYINLFGAIPLLDILQTTSSIIAIGIAIYAVTSEGKRARISLKVETHLRFSSEFNSVEFKRKRLATVDVMEKCLSENQPDIIKIDRVNHAVKGEIFDFFQKLGRFCKRDFLDAEDLWSEYSYWLFHYWQFFEEYTRRERLNALYWGDVDWLLEKINKIDIKKKGIEPNDYLEFINYERNCCL